MSNTEKIKDLEARSFLFIVHNEKAYKSLFFIGIVFDDRDLRIVGYRSFHFFFNFFFNFFFLSFLSSFCSFLSFFCSFLSFFLGKNYFFFNYFFFNGFFAGNVFDETDLRNVSCGSFFNYFFFNYFFLGYVVSKSNFSKFPVRSATSKHECEEDVKQCATKNLKRVVGNILHKSTLRINNGVQCDNECSNFDQAQNEKFDGVPYAGTKRDCLRCFVTICHFFASFTREKRKYNFIVKLLYYIFFHLSIYFPKKYTFFYIFFKILLNCEVFLFGRFDYEMKSLKNAPIFLLFFYL